MTDYAKVRENMVDSQIRPNKVTNPLVLNAFLEVPRELFVPAALRGAAYIDEDLPVGPGRFLIEPMVLARLVQAADVAPGDVALSVGSGVGYEAAILARLARAVVGVEGDGALVARAEAVLADLSIDNVTLITGDPARGHAAKAPYDVILLGGAVASVPNALTDQLAEGGRLVGVLKPDERAVGHAVLIERVRGGLAQRVLFDAAIARLPGFAPIPAFVF